MLLVYSIVTAEDGTENFDSPMTSASTAVAYGTASAAALSEEVSLLGCTRSGIHTSGEVMQVAVFSSTTSECLTLIRLVCIVTWQSSGTTSSYFFPAPALSIAWRSLRASSAMAVGLRPRSWPFSEARWSSSSWKPETWMDAIVRCRRSVL